MMPRFPQGDGQILGVGWLAALFVAGDVHEAVLIPHFCVFWLSLIESFLWCTAVFCLGCVVDFFTFAVRNVVIV